MESGRNKASFALINKGYDAGWRPGSPVKTPRRLRKHSGCTLMLLYNRFELQ